MLHYFENTTEENAENENLKKIHQMVEKVKQNKEVSAEYMFWRDKEQQWKEEGREDERKNTEMERQRKEEALKENEKLKKELERLRAQLKEQPT